LSEIISIAKIAEKNFSLEESYIYSYTHIHICNKIEMQREKHVKQGIE